MSQIKSGFIILIVSLVLWFGIDFIFTKFFGTIGFSEFFAHNNIVGRINKPGFKGSFGGPLEDYFSSVSIGIHGERNSTTPKCNLIKKKVIFLGDSTTAGFEVDDDETFVSLINQTCPAHLSSGLNFGVRAYDTHTVSALYELIKTFVPHDKLFYLISINDFEENIDRNAYPTMTSKFGRFFQGRLIYPVSEGSLENLYLSTRIFIGKNFYLSTTLISHLERLPRYFFHKKNIITENSKLQVRFDTMKVLLNNLALQAMSKKVDLYIAIYPNLSENSKQSNEQLYEEMLTEQYINQPINIKVLELAKFIELKSNLGCLKKSAMRFRNDSHLSKFGHKVVSDFLRVELLNDESITLESLCYK